MIRVETHRLGPRVYLLGMRVHEVAVGLAVLAVVALLLAFGIVRPGEEVLAAAGVGAWLVWKDWRDLVPRWRNTCSHRRLGAHRRPTTAAAPRSAAPAFAAAAVLGLVLLQFVAFLAPSSRPAHLVAAMAPSFAHVVALPLIGALLPVAAALHEGRKNAVAWAVGLLLALSLVFVVDGSHLDRAAICIALAGALYVARSAFVAESVALSARRAFAAVTAALAGTVILVRVDASPHSDLVSASAALACVLSFALASRLLLGDVRPLTGTSDDSATARALVRERGSDTLDAFKLRGDARYVTSDDGEALLAYRVSNGVMLVAGDPVGPPERIPELLVRARDEAARHGLRIAVLSAGGRGAVAWREAGLRSVYLGDEAILDCRSFSLEGRAIRKVRQSVNRLTKAGYTSELVPVRALVADERAQLCRLSDRWRGRAPERGFTMACTLDERAADDGLVAVARDESGEARALLLLLPVAGGGAYSLALMRRAAHTPNGLTEFLVVEAVERLRALGATELSLNFALLGRCLREGGSWRLRLLRRGMRAADRWFQLERLYRFNDKFFPRWKPRYLMFESTADTPRVALCALVVEGFLPRLPRRETSRATRQ